MAHVVLLQAMDALGLPCAYGEFLDTPPIPFTVVLYYDSDDLMADNQNYTGIGNYLLELYNDEKHPPTEKLIENKLRELRLPFYKSERLIREERLYQVAYQIQLIGE